MSANAIVARYDADAADYERYWAPVLVETSGRLLDAIDAAVASAGARRGTADGAVGGGSVAGGARILDVGAGTGTLALSAVQRWPEARVVVSDAAAGMLDVARRRLAEKAQPDAARIEFALGPADGLPLPDASVDVAMSSFVLQLVPDRPAALREIGRVLRPGGLLAYVTWLDRDAPGPFRAAEEFDEAVFELEIEEPEEGHEPHAGDVRSGRAAAAELRRAGFVNASAREELLVHDWTMESYLEYKLAYDERALVKWLDQGRRAELERNARARLARLSPRDLRWQAPVVFARAERPS